MFSQLRELRLLRHPRAVPRGDHRQRHSLPMASLGPEHVEKLAARFSRKLDGTSCAATTFRRRSSILHAFLKRAIKRRLVRPDLLDDVRLDTTGVVEEVRVDELPSSALCAQLVDHCAEQPVGSAMHRFRIAFALTLYAGLRPSEVAGLRLRSLDFDGLGGTILVTEAVTRPGHRFGTTNGSRTRKALKHRRARERREIPMPAVLAPQLRNHLSDYTAADASPDEPFLVNAAGNLVSADNLGRAFRMASAATLGPRWDWATHYTLRHVHITSLLRAGTPREEVSRRVGASLAVIDSVYRGAFSEDRELVVSGTTSTLRVPRRAEFRRERAAARSDRRSAPWPESGDLIAGVGGCLVGRRRTQTRSFEVSAPLSGP